MSEAEIIIKAISKVMEQGTLITFMLLVIAGLCGFIRYLLLELKDSRKGFTASTEKFIETISEMKEILRYALHKN